MMLTRIYDLLELLLEKTIAILCLVLLTFLLIEVVNRYLIGGSWAGIQYIIPFCFLWVCMLGSALAIRKHQHFEIDFLSKILIGTPQKIHKTVIILLLMLAGGIIVWASLDFIALGLLKKSPATGISMVYIYASIMAGGVLIFLMAFEQLVNQWHHRTLPTATQQGE